MRITGIHHVALRSRDFDRSVHFYTQVMGMNVKMVWNDPPRRAAMLDVGDGNYVEIFERPDSSAADPQRGFSTGEDVLLHFCLRVEDCAAMMEKVRAAGVHVAKATKQAFIPNTAPGLPSPVEVTLAFFNGPDGELIELMENDLV